MQSSIHSPLLVIAIVFAGGVPAYSAPPSAQDSGLLRVEDSSAAALPIPGTKDPHATHSSGRGWAEIAATRPATFSVAFSTAFSKSRPAPPVRKKKVFTEAIEDNSFLIEEAYNQEAGVVQHISNCSYFRSPVWSVNCSFTQEWPFHTEKHQLSYTVPFWSIQSAGSAGVGDVMLNYRYQLFSKDQWAAVSPRVSLIVPTGSVAKGMGMGSTGVQFNLPVSKRLSNEFVAHFNAGMTVLPGAKSLGPDGTTRHTLVSYNLGASAIWLLRKNLNLMTEYVVNFTNAIDDAGKAYRFTDHIVSPGLRYAIDLGGLQIVPGFAVPVDISQGKTYRGFFFYLSFEHPFRKISSSPATAGSQRSVTTSEADHQTPVIRDRQL